MTSRSIDPPRDLGGPDFSADEIDPDRRVLDSIRPLTVLRVIARLNVGGPAIQASLLTSGLDQKRFISTLVTGREASREGNMLELASELEFTSGVEPVIVEDLGRSISPLRDLRALFSLIRIMRRLRPDVVHTHTAKAGTLGRIAAITTRVPVVVHTFHGHTFHGYFNKATSLMVSLWESLLARFSSAVIAISPRQAADLIDAGLPRKKVRIIPLGLPLERFANGSARGDARSALKIGDDETVIGMVARLVPVKDPFLMVDAVAELSLNDPSTSLLIVGDGPLREEVEAHARHRGVHVRVLTWRADLENIYPAMDVVALSSKNEGSPVALIEALAAGRPVASTNVGGVADLLADGEYGHLADEATPTGLAGAIARAIETDPAQLALARRSALDRFGSDRLIRDISALYEGLAAARVARVTRNRKRRNAAKAP